MRCDLHDCLSERALALPSSRSASEERSGIQAKLKDTELVQRRRGSDLFKNTSRVSSKECRWGQGRKHGDNVSRVCVTLR